MSAPSPRRYAPRLPPEERREQVLDATLHLIAEHGYAGASMEAVARAAGIAKPVVYDLFGGRGELLRALLEREERRAIGQLADALPDAARSGGDPDAVAAAALVAFLGSVAENPDPWRLVLLPAAGTPDLVAEHVDRGRAWVAGQLQAFVEWAAAERGAKGLDAELAAQAILAVCEHAGRLVLLDPARYTPGRFGAFAQAVIASMHPG